MIAFDSKLDSARRKMVETQVIPVGVTDKGVLAAIGKVPRELFVPAAWRDLSYADTAIPLGGARRLGPAAPFARFLQLAGIEATDRVLDVGCASGYSAAVLGHLSQQVTATEADAGLARSARDAITALGIGKVEVVEASVVDLPRGIGPFDVIIVEDIVEAVPKGLFALLADGGRLVGAIAGDANAVAHLYVRSGDDVAGRPDFDMSLSSGLGHRSETGFVF